jgi:hypothetical protein
VARYAAPGTSQDSTGVRCLVRELLWGVGGNRWYEQLFFRAGGRTGSIDRALDVACYALTAYPQGRSGPRLPARGLNGDELLCAAGLEAVFADRPDFQSSCLGLRSLGVGVILYTQ